MAIEIGKLYSYETEEGLNMGIVDKIANGLVILDSGQQIPLQEFSSSANLVMDGNDEQYDLNSGFEIKLDKNGFPILPTLDKKPAPTVVVKEEVKVNNATKISNTVPTGLDEDHKAVMILLQKSKKENKEVNMVLPLLLPSKSFMDMVSQSFDNDMSDIIIDGILNSIDQEEIIKAIRGCLKKIYEI
jgi:hypothetical protein